MTAACDCVSPNGGAKWEHVLHQSSEKWKVGKPSGLLTGIFLVSGVLFLTHFLKWNRIRVGFLEETQLVTKLGVPSLSLRLLCPCPLLNHLSCPAYPKSNIRLITGGRLALHNCHSLWCRCVHCSRACTCSVGSLLFQDFASILCSLGVKCELRWSRTGQEKHTKEQADNGSAETHGISGRPWALRHGPGELKLCHKRGILCAHHQHCSFIFNVFFSLDV